MTTTISHPATLRASVSFYVPASKPRLIEASAALTDTVTVRGRNGPEIARAVLGRDWNGALLFDHAAYESAEPNAHPEAWFELQSKAGADRLLTPGRWVPWTVESDALAVATEAEQHAALHAPGSTIVLALDSRWLGKAAPTVIDILQGHGGPVALVLAHRQDPLSQTGVLDGLLALLRKVPDVTLLRLDHGAIGAVAFNAAHGSVGLQPTYRHFVAPGATAWAKWNDRTPRVFVWDLMDWFTAGTIAGWGAGSVSLACRFPCCDGASIDRFLDPQWTEEADVHNRTVLAHLADRILDDEPTARRRAFARLCAEAVERYGPMGKLSDLLEPKPQLVQWAQWA